VTPVLALTACASPHACNAAPRPPPPRPPQAEAFDLQRYLVESEAKAAALVARTAELEALIRDERSRWGAEAEAAAGRATVG